MSCESPVLCYDHDDNELICMTTVLSRKRPMCIDCGEVEVNIPTSDRSPVFCSALSCLPARFRQEIGGLFLFTDVDLDS